MKDFLTVFSNSYRDIEKSEFIFLILPDELEQDRKDFVNIKVKLMKTSVPNLEIGEEFFLYVLKSDIYLILDSDVFKMNIKRFKVDDKSCIKRTYTSI